MTTCAHDTSVGSVIVAGGWSRCQLRRVDAIRMTQSHAGLKVTMAGTCPRVAAAPQPRGVRRNRVAVRIQVTPLAACSISCVERRRVRSSGPFRGPIEWLPNGKIGGPVAAQTTERRPTTTAYPSRCLSHRTDGRSIAEKSDVLAAMQIDSNGCSILVGLRSCSRDSPFLPKRPPAVVSAGNRMVRLTRPYKRPARALAILRFCRSDRPALFGRGT